MVYKKLNPTFEMVCMSYKIMIASFFSILSCVVFAQSQNLLPIILKNNELNICQTSGYAPYSYKNIDGSWDGLNVVIDNEFAKFIGVKPHHIEIEWTGSIAALLTKKCDMMSIGVVDTPEREQVISFGDPVFTSNVLLVLRNEPQLLKWAFTNDTTPNYDKLKLAVAEGTSSEYWATIAHINYLTYKTYDTPVNAVLNKKVDGFIFEESFVKKLPLHIQNKLFIYKKPFQVEKVSAGFRKGDQDLKDKFNEFVKEFLKSGKLPVLQEKYLPGVVIEK